MDSTSRCRFYASQQRRGLAGQSDRLGIFKYSSWWVLPQPKEQLGFFSLCKGGVWRRATDGHRPCRSTLFKDGSWSEWVRKLIRACGCTGIYYALFWSNEACTLNPYYVRHIRYKERLQNYYCSVKLRGILLMLIDLKIHIASRVARRKIM